MLYCVAEIAQGFSSKSYIHVVTKKEKKNLVKKGSNQGPSPAKHVVTNKGKQDKLAGFKQRIISSIQMFFHSFILLTTLNCVYMCCNKAQVLNNTVQCTVYV